MGNLQHTCPQVQNVQQFLTKNSMTPTPHPLYSSDLTPSAFFFGLPDKKTSSKGNFCADVEEVKQKTAKVLKGIKIDEFQNCFEQWRKMSR